MGNSLGLFFSGAARNRNQRQGRELQARAIGLQERQLQGQRDQELFDRTVESIRERVEITQQILSELPEPGNSAGATRIRQQMLQDIAATIGPASARFPDRMQVLEGLGRSAQAAIANAPTAIDVAEREGESAAATARATAETFGGTPEDVARNTASLLGLGPRDEGEFIRLLNELERTPVGTERANNLRARINRLSQTEGGLSIRFNPDGTVSAITTGGAGLGAGLSASQAEQQAAAIQRLERNVELVDRLIQEVETNPTAFGVAGSIRRGAQTAAGVTSDLLGAGVETFLGIDLTAIADRLRGTLQQVTGGEELEEFFDPQLPKTELLENTLAFELANLRLQDSESRAITQLFRDAKEDVKLTGLTSTRNVLSKLREIRGLFDQARRDRIGRLSGQEADSLLAAPPAQDELDARVREILQ